MGSRRSGNKPFKELPAEHLYHKTCHYLMLYKNDTNGIS